MEEKLKGAGLETGISGCYISPAKRNSKQGYDRGDGEKRVFKEELQTDLM